MIINVRRLEILLAKRKLKKCKLAEAAGIRPESLSYILKRGRCNPYNLGRIAEALGVSVEELADEEN